MKGKYKKTIAFLMALTFIFSICMTAYADVVPSNLDQTQVEDTGGGEEQPTVTDEVYDPGTIVVPPIQLPVVQKAYEVKYLLKGTEDAVPGLNELTGSGDVGATIEIPHPSVEGYQVLADQSTSLTINEDESLNKVVVYYEAVVVQGAKLTVNHIYYSNDKEVKEVQLIEGLKAGTEINPTDYALNRENLEYAGSDKESLLISDTEANEISLYYNKIVKAEEQPIEVIGSAIKPLKALAAAEAMSDTSTPGDVFINKTAQWIDRNAGIAKVVLDINGNPVPSGADVVLVLDRSGSMADNNRLTKTKNAAKAFITELYKANGSTASDNRIALVTFSDNASKYPNAGSSQEKLLGVNDTSGGMNATEYFNSKINDMSANGGTNYDNAFNAAKEIINGRKDKKRPTYVVFMSDGEPNGYWSWFQYYYYDGKSTATSLKNSGTKIYSLGLGLTGSSFEDFIEPLASEPKSDYAKEISDQSDLTTILTQIAGEMKVAGTNAVVTDLIKTAYFDITTKPGGNVYYEATYGTVTISSDKKTVTWDVRDIISTQKTLTIYIKLKSSVTTPGYYDTNESANVRYTDYNNKTQNKVYPKPQLDVGPYYTVTFTPGSHGSLNGTASFPNILSGTAWGTAIQTVPTPVAAPGYMPNGWTPALPGASAPITGNATYTANFVANNNTAYRVEHYKQDLNAATYTLSETDNLIGTTDTTVNAIAKTYQGYTYDSSIAGTMVSGTIAGDGSLVLKLYYKANIDTAYTVNHYLQNPDGTYPTTATHTESLAGTTGKSVTAVANSYPGYSYDAAIAGTVVSGTIAGDGSLVLKLYYKANTDTVYTVNHYLQNSDGTYPTTPTHADSLAGTTGAPVTAQANSYPGYTYDSSIAGTMASGTIAGDGSLVFKLYYKKNYSITYQAGANGSFEGIASGVRKDLKFYGDSYSAAPTPVANSGYYFSGWTPALPGAEEKVTGDKTFTAYFALITNGGGGGGSKDRDDKDDTTVKTVTVVDEEIPAGVPELNKEEHFQYLQGYPDNTVRPEGNITREEVAAVFYRLLTKEYRESIMTTSHNFPDVEKGRWSTKYIATLAKGGILEGDPDGKYRPGDFITKAELSVVASKFDKLSPFSGDMFKDISGHWANKYINSAAQKGWVKGNPDGTFNPDKYITRAEFATLVNNVLERRVHKEDILPGARKFPDLHETDWYYEAMMEAINSHYYERSQDGYEKWTEIYYPDLDL